MSYSVNCTAVISNTENGNVDLAEAEKLINFNNVTTVNIHIHNEAACTEERVRSAELESKSTGINFSELDRLMLVSPPIVSTPYFGLKGLKRFFSK